MKDLHKGYLILFGCLIGMVSFAVAAKHMPTIQFTTGK